MLLMRSGTFHKNDDTLIKVTTPIHTTISQPSTVINELMIRKLIK